MNKNIILMTAFILLSVSAFGQKYYSKTGEISFFSNTSMEDIEAVSQSASTVMDIETGKIQWAVLIKSFEFDKALMQEHFNENYMESSKFPKAKFKGVISNMETIDFSKNGEYIANISGTLEIHGVTKEVTTMATFKVENKAVSASCDMKVALADYEIKIPAVVKENIAKEIEIKLKANYEILAKS